MNVKGKWNNDGNLEWTFKIDEVEITIGDKKLISWCNRNMRKYGVYKEPTDGIIRQMHVDAFVSEINQFINGDI